MSSMPSPPSWLGGTSVFGGRGSVWGTLGGLFAIAVLQNACILAALPSELTGVLVGTLLSPPSRSIDRGAAAARASTSSEGEEPIVRNLPTPVPVRHRPSAGALIVSAPTSG